MSSPKTAASLNTANNNAANPNSGSTKPEEQQPTTVASSTNQVQVAVAEGARETANSSSSTTTNATQGSTSLQTPSQQGQGNTANLEQQKPAGDASENQDGTAAPQGTEEDQEEIITGVLEKKGAIGTAGQLRWTERYVVLNNGIMTYHKSVGDYEANKPPRKNNRVELRLYSVIAGEPPESEIIDPSRQGKAAKPDNDYSRAFYLRPLPFEGCPTRTWEFRAVELEDLADWIAVFQEQGCASEETYKALLTAGAAGKDVVMNVASKLLSGGAAHPIVAEKRNFVAPLPPVEAVAVATANEKAALAAVAAAKGIVVDGATGGSGSSSSSSAAAPAGDSASAAAGSSSAPAESAASATTGAAASGLPYNACNMVLTPALTADLCDPSTDSQDPHCHAAYLKKKGEKHLDGYKSRWCVVKRGFLMYWDVEAKRARVSCTTGLYRCTLDITFFLQPSIH
jgi:hypothetical protein